MKVYRCSRTIKIRARLIGLISAVALVVIIAGIASAGDQVLRFSDSQIIGFEQMIEELKGTRLIFVGEIHDRSEHHTAQLKIIKAFRQAGVPFAIGLEMFTAESQGELDRWVSGELDIDSFIKLYNREWHMSWSLYKDIFLYAREYRIPLIGLNVPREITRKVARDGFGALTPDERKQLPEGIACAVDPKYRAFIRKAYMMGHVADDKTFNHFCEAQMIWNKSLGRNLQRFLARHPGQAVIVLAGSGHAMKRGIPDEVFRDSVNSYKVLLPELPDFSRDSVDNADADYLMLFEIPITTETAP